MVKAFPKSAHRYYKLKAGWLGLDKLEYWDRNAPMPDSDDSFVGWVDARRRPAGRLGNWTATPDASVTRDVQELRF